MHGLYTERNIGDTDAAEVVTLNALQDASNTNINANNILDCNIAYHGKSIPVVVIIRMFAVISSNPDGHRHIVHAHISYVHVPHIPTTAWSCLDSDPVQGVHNAEALSPDFGYAT